MFNLLVCGSFTYHAGVGILITMLGTPEHVLDVYMGRHGILAASGGSVPSLVVDCSTTDPPLARKIAGKWGRHSSQRSAYMWPWCLFAAAQSYQPA